MESSKERMQNSGPITQNLISPLRVMQKRLPASLGLHVLFTIPLWPPPCLLSCLVPMTSLSLLPVPDSVASYPDPPGLPTPCPDHLPPLTGFTPSHLPAWGPSTLAFPPSPPTTTCFPPSPLPCICRPFRLAPLFSHTSPFTPAPPPHPASSPTCMGLGPR